MHKTVTQEMASEALEIESLSNCGDHEDLEADHEPTAVPENSRDVLTTDRETLSSEQQPQVAVLSASDQARNNDPANPIVSSVRPSGGPEVAICQPSSGENQRREGASPATESQLRVGRVSEVEDTRAPVSTQPQLQHPRTQPTMEGRPSPQTTNLAQRGPEQQLLVEQPPPTYTNLFPNGVGPSGHCQSHHMRSQYSSSFNDQHRFHLVAPQHNNIPPQSSIQFCLPYGQRCSVCLPPSSPLFPLAGHHLHDHHTGLVPLPGAISQQAEYSHMAGQLAVSEYYSSHC